MNWNFPDWFHRYPRLPWRAPGFRLWWEHAPPLHTRDVRKVAPPRHPAIRGRNKSKGAVRMPRVRMPNCSRSARI